MKKFLLGFALVTLVCAGVLSYFASSAPDGLDSATLKGCEVVETDQGEQLTGNCIAQRAGEHHLSDSPFADYTVGGDDRFTGVAGVVGVLITAGLAGGLFWLLRRRSSTAGAASESEPTGP